MPLVVFGIEMLYQTEIAETTATKSASATKMMDSILAKFKFYHLVRSKETAKLLSVRWTIFEKFEVAELH